MELKELISERRDEIIERARAKACARSESPATEHGSRHGIPLFLTQLGTALADGDKLSSELRSNLQLSAAIHGRELLDQGCDAGQVVVMNPGFEASATPPAPAVTPGHQCALRSTPASRRKAMTRATKALSSRSPRDQSSHVVELSWQ